MLNRYDKDRMKKSPGMYVKKKFQPENKFNL